MTTLHVKVEGKAATYLRREGAIVCGNDDYRIAFAFDDEWAGYENKTARFIWGGTYFDVDFTGTECDVPAIPFATEVAVGLYVNDSVRTTTSAVIPCVPSVLSGGEAPNPGYGAQYVNDIKRAAADAEAAADTAESAATTATGKAAIASQAATTAEAAAASAEASAQTAREAADEATGAVAIATEARTKAETATANAAGAVSTANAAKTAADEAKRIAGTAESNATAANTTAGNASAAASRAETNASEALTRANEALGKTVTNANNIGVVLSRANAAKSTADAAQSTAGTALTKANTATDKADAAITTAHEAHEAALKAGNDATEAKTTATQAKIAVAGKLDASAYTFAEKATGGAVAVRDDAGALAVARATAPEHAATLGQVDEVTSALRKRVVNLEQGLTPDPFETDATVAYAKAVPDGVLPFALVSAVGGMTHAEAIHSSNLFNVAALDGVEGVVVNKATVNKATGELTGADFYTYDTTLKDLCPAMELGKTYTLSVVCTNPYWEVHGSGWTLYSNGLFMNDLSFVANNGHLNAGGFGFRSYVDDAMLDMQEGTFLIMINEGTEALPWEPYGPLGYILRDTKVTALVSANAEGTELGRIAVPAAVQALDGYGWGISADVHNGIEWDESGKARFVKRVGRKTFDGTEPGWWENTNNNGYFVVIPLADDVAEGCSLVVNRYRNGVPVQIGIPCAYMTTKSIVIFPGADAATLAEWKAKLAEWAAAGDPLTVYYQLATPVVTDVSHLVTLDNLIAVEGGGTITAQNENGDAAPSTVIYQIKQ